MNKIPNRRAICDTLMETVKEDKGIMVLCSDSRGSISLTPFADACPDQSVEMDIAEQNLVSMPTGLARCGKKPFAVSLAHFLSTKSYERIKVDTAYPNANIKLIDISGGTSYGTLGTSHHSAQDIAALSAIPNMRVYLPSNHFQTACLVRELLKNDKPAYIRVGRSVVEDTYEEGNVPLSMDKATVLSRGGDVAIIACGETVKPALGAGRLLGEPGISADVVDMYCVESLDEGAVQKIIGAARLVATVEEHIPFGGLDSRVNQVVLACCPRMVVNSSLPDEPVITGTPVEIFEYYGLTGQGVARRVQELLRQF